MSSSMKNKIKKLLVTYIPLSLIIIFVLFPIYWTLNMSFMSDKLILSREINYYPKGFTFQNYIETWNGMGFANYFKNSLLTSLSSSISVIFVSILTGYALARYKFRGKGFFMLLLLCTQFFPGPMLLGPLFNIFKSIGLLNNRLSLVITYTTLQMSFNSILMRSFVSGIPYAIEEAAHIDGCSNFRKIRHILIPLLMPGIIAGFCFAFIAAWKDFLWAFMFMNDSNKFTISVALHYMLGEYTMNYGYLAAGGIIALTPPMIIFLYIQRYLVQGLNLGAVKG